MSEQKQRTWRAILFYWLGGQDRQAVREWSAAAKGFDSGWLRWPLNLCTLACAANFFAFVDYHEVFQWTALIADAATGLLLCLYLGHILFRRLQFSLLEFVLMIAVMGNFEGLLFTTPAIFFGWVGLASLALLVAAWILYGMVEGLVQARILGVTKPWQRVLILVAAWLTTIVPALIFSGAFLSLGLNEGLKTIISRPMAQWGPWLLALGVLGLVIRVWLGRKVRRMAKEILASNAPRP